MTDLRPTLARLRDRIPAPSGGLERLILYRERRRRRRRIGTIGMALILGVAGTLVAVRAFAPHERSTPAAPLPHGAISFVRGTILAGASIPDAEIYLMEPDGSSVRKLTDAAAEGKVAAEPAWSPDGTRIAFVLSTPEHLGAYAGDGDVYVMNSDGTGLTKLTDGLRDAHPAWSPDGTRIVFVRDQGNSLVVMNADGSDATEIRPHGQAFPPYQGPAWSPDGTRIAFQASPSAGVDTNGVYVTDVDGNGTARVTPGSSDGSPAWSPDGTTLAYAGSDGIYLHDMQNGTNHRLTICGKRENCGFDFEPSWAPDGSRIVFARQDYGGSSVQIFVVNADGTGVQQLTSGPEWNAEPIWQPVPVEGGAPSPGPSTSMPSPATPVRAQVTDMLRFEGYVCCAAYGDGSLWVSVSNADGSYAGHLVRIDADTGKTADEIPVPGVPTWEVGGGGLAVGDGSVWIATSATGEGTLNSPGGGSDALLVRVDTSTDEVVDQVNLGGLHGDDIVVDDTGVWVLIDGAGNQMHVIRIDPTNDQIVADIQLDSTYAHFILSAGGRVLVLGNRGDPRNLAEPISWVHVIDPSSNTVVDSVSLGDYARLDESPDGTVLWGLGTHGSIIFDPSTRSVTSISNSSGTGDAVAAGEGRLWYFGPNRAEVQGVDMATGSLDVEVRLPDGATPIALITSPGAVWVMDYSAMVYRITLTPTG